MKIAISALLLSLASASACAASHAVPPDSVAQRAHPGSPYHMRENGLRHLNISLTGIEQESMELVLIGTIDVNMAQAVKELTGRYPIRAVVVDSYGGNIDSAMDIAAILRAKKLDLIVDGRCLSACANYLFPAAARKTVLPGSVVGIHNIRVTYQEKGAVALVPATDAARLFQSRGDMNSLEQFERTQRREQAFYRDMGWAYGRTITRPTCATWPTARPISAQKRLRARRARTTAARPSRCGPWTVCSSKRWACKASANSGSPPPMRKNRHWRSTWLFPPPSCTSAAPQAWRNCAARLPAHGQGWHGVSRLCSLACQPATRRAKGR